MGGRNITSAILFDKLGETYRIFYVHRYKIAVILLIFYSLILRMGHLQPGYFARDIQRDYLIGNHIVMYGEIPASGPQNSVFGSNTIVPVYYYFVAFLLLINNNVVFLHVVNIIFQILIMVFLYVITQKLFSSKSAILGVLLFSFSNVILRQSTFFYQPFLAGFFIYLTYLLLLFSYKKKNFLLLFSGILAYLIGAILHSSLLALLPVIFTLLILILRECSAKLWQYISVTSFAIFVFLVSYYPLFKTVGGPRILNKFINTPHEFFSNLWVNSIYFFGSFFNFFSFIGENISQNTVFSKLPESYEDLSILSLFSFVAVLIVVVVYFGSSFISRSHKIYTAILLVTIFVYILIMSLLHMPEKAFTHFIPIYGLFLIVISECIHTVLQKNYYLVVLKVLLIILLIYTFAFKNFFFLPRSMSFDNSIYIPISSIESKILEIKKNENFPNYHFFDILQYIHWPDGGGGDYLAHPYFWTKIELDLNEQFVALSGDSNIGFKSINGNQFIFLTCQPNLAFECKNYFLETHPEHRFLENFYNDGNYSIYLTQRDADV